MSRPLSLIAGLLLAASAAPRAVANDSDLDHPPFDFTNAFYLANGIDPATLIGRPDGTPPGSVIDPITPHGPQFNDVRILEVAAAYDDSGHPILFYVTGLPTPASFLPNSAGDEALEIAEKYKVYEFPRAANPDFAVFPKRQDLIADLSNGYFSGDPLGIWQVNLVKYSATAFSTSAGQQKLAQLAAKNGVDLDGTPVIKTKSEVFDLLQNGFATLQTPPVGIGRWFFCPVLKDPRGGELTPDAHLTIVELADGTPLPAQQDIYDFFHCIQATDEECDSSDQASVAVRLGQPANPNVFSAVGAPVVGTTWDLGVDHASFFPSAAADVLLLGKTPINAFAGAPGALLVSPLQIFVGSPGQTFGLPVPLTTSLVGVRFSVQAAAALPSGALELTNALDAEIGTHGS